MSVKIIGECVIAGCERPARYSSGRCDSHFHRPGTPTGIAVESVCFVTGADGIRRAVWQSYDRKALHYVAERFGVEIERIALKTQSIDHPYKNLYRVQVSIEDFEKQRVAA